MGSLQDQITACRLCAGRFAATATHHAPRPVAWFREGARILIVGQAPGLRVHESGRPFTDRSGQRLRQWMGVDDATFYDRDRIAIAAPRVSSVWVCVAAIACSPRAVRRHPHGAPTAIPGSAGQHPGWRRSAVARRGWSRMQRSRLLDRAATAALRSPRPLFLQGEGLSATGGRAPATG